MSYQTRKTLAGQEVVKKLTFKLNKCKYTSEPFTVENRLYNNNVSVIGSTTTGITMNVSQLGGSSWLDTWDGYPTYPFLFFVLKNEVIKVQVINSTSVTIIKRKLFGTVGGTISRFNVITIMHEGYLDGSCYGYSQTCSNTDSYESGLFKDLVFSTSPLQAGAVYHGGLKFKDVRYQSAEIKPGESIGSRSRVSFSILDQKHNGYDVVYYEDRRTEFGTLFGKLLAMHPYFNGRTAIYSVGLRDAGTLDEPEWEDRPLLIDSVNLSNGIFSGSALDPLILTEGKKAKMPLASPAQLTTAINSGSTTVVFGNAPANYFGSSGNVIVRIDSELIEVTANGTTTMPIVTRGFGRSEIKDHLINATVQNCIRFIDEHVIDCITYALEAWTGTPASFIDDYSPTIALIPSAIISDYTLSSPIDVVEFINRCIFIGNLIFYFDDVAQKIVIKYISEIDISPIYINESDHIKKDSVNKDLNSKEQYTRFNLSWAPFDLTKDTDQKNYQISLTGVNLSVESPNKMGETNERKAMLLPMLSASSPDYLLGASAVNRVISASDQPPEVFVCELDAESIGYTQGSSLDLGSIVSLQHSDNQNKSGIGEPVLYQCVKIDGDAFESFSVKFKRYQSFVPDDFDYVIDAGSYINYVLTDHYSPVSPGEYIVYVSPGAVFGSYDTAVAAFKTGTPASGVAFKFISRWQVLGMGGAGGDCGISGTAAQSGFDGGIAFEANCDCVIDNGAGLIWAGGGGEGGEEYISPQGASLTLVPRSGGGAGQGFGTSIGGKNSDGAVFTTRAPSGSQSSPSYGGGEWGADGARVGFSSLGGLAGIAIKSNGFSVTIISGDNPLSIRGRRA